MEGCQNLRRVKIGIIGCGFISGIYLKNCTQMFDTILEVKAVTDLMPELAKRRAEEFGVQHVFTVDELLNDPEIEIVLNLTAPVAHAPLNLKALHAGKHVYTEKPFALSREDADEVLALAELKGLLVGSAPDTFMGAGIQTCRKLIDDGWIGKPYATSASIIMGNSSSGMHPNFQNFLKLGGDPIMDMGPYYLTAMVTLLGPVRRVTGSTQQVNKEITVINPKSPRFGDTVPVEAPTNVAATLDFHNGAVGSLQACKEAFGYSPRMEVYGTEGILYVPDANFFGGTVSIKLPNGQTKEVPHSHGYAEDSRGIGVADMAYANQPGHQNRASGQRPRHIIDISLSIFESSEHERHITLASSNERPMPLPLGLKFNTLDS